MRGTKGHESELHQQSLIGFFKRLYIYVHVPSLSDEQSGRSPHVALSYPRPDQGQMIIQFGRALRQHFFAEVLIYETEYALLQFPVILKCISYEFFLPAIINFVFLD